MDATLGRNDEVTGKKPKVRYIKLGQGNAWAERAFREGELPLSFREVPHELAMTADKRAIAAHLIGKGKNASAAMNAAGQVCAFYDGDGEAVWITFANGRMWWCHASPEVTWLGASDEYAPRVRRASWVSQDKFGVPFDIGALSSRLTKVASMLSTICSVEAADYVLRKIAGIEEPSVERARRSKSEALEAILDLIGNLHWSEFETLVDLLLARSGWHRISALGETMKDADMIVEQAVTRETAFVQVKSSSTQKELDRYVAIFDANATWTRMIYACHTAPAALVSPRPDVIIWARSDLAEMIFRQGLFDWLVERAG